MLEANVLDPIQRRPSAKMCLSSLLYVCEKFIISLITSPEKKGTFLSKFTAKDQEEDVQLGAL